MQEARMKRLEFLLCGSPTDAFWSQLAMFRLSLDSLGPEFRAARLVLVLADHEQKPLPQRWRPWFGDIEIAWAPLESFLEFGDGEDHLFHLIDPDADISFICDADTLLIRDIPGQWLDQMIDEPAIHGVIAHLPPPKSDHAGNNRSQLANEEFWRELSLHVLGQEIELPEHYTMEPALGGCPFYINYGFIAGPPALLKELHRNLTIVQPRVRSWLDNDFYGQLGIALAVELGDLPTRVLPMRYNFPNDERFDDRYPEELQEVVLIHYLRTRLFDRHQIFTDQAQFKRFMALSLEGSNAAFQQRILELTGGEYPFDPALPALKPGPRQ
jgi:hypothetical protein